MFKGLFLKTIGIIFSIFDCELSDHLILGGFNDMGRIRIKTRDEQKKYFTINRQIGLGRLSDKRRK